MPIHHISRMPVPYSNTNSLQFSGNFAAGTRGITWMGLLSWNFVGLVRPGVGVRVGLPYRRLWTWPRLCQQSFAPGLYHVESEKSHQEMMNSEIPVREINPTLFHHMLSFSRALYISSYLFPAGSSPKTGANTAPRFRMSPLWIRPGQRMLHSGPTCPVVPRDLRMWTSTTYVDVDWISHWMWLNLT